jgi:hypothetical protein
MIKSDIPKSELDWGCNMRTIRAKLKLLVTVVALCSLGTLTSTKVMAEKKGQDYPGEKCDRTNKDGTTTTGQCSSVCKDLDVDPVKDVNTGHRTCKQAFVMPGGGLVPVTGHPSIQFLRYNDLGQVQACSLTPKLGVDELLCRDITVREVEGKSAQ